MEIVYSLLAYKVASLLVGLASIYMGYLLFTKSVWGDAGDIEAASAFLSPLVTSPAGSQEGTGYARLVNLMEYVTHVLMKVFGWNRAKAEKHMLEVHNSGKSVLAREGRERAEHYVHELQRHHLHASLEKAD